MNRDEMRDFLVELADALGVPRRIYQTESDYATLALPAPMSGIDVYYAPESDSGLWSGQIYYEVYPFRDDRYNFTANSAPRSELLESIVGMMLRGEQ